MGRQKGPDQEKIKKIKQILSKNPNGLWVREISRLINMDKSTVSIYLTKYMNSEIEEVFPIRDKLIKIVRFKK